jgi:hypothetical protein
MDFSKLSLIRQVEIESPCPEDWNAMRGDEARRFCAGCGCHVHNLAQIPASEAEQLLTQPDRVCARITVDPKKGILTRDGWIPRLLAAGALAATAAGCAPTVTTGDPSISSIGQTIASAPTKKSTPVTITQKAKPKDKKPTKKKPRVLLGDVSPGLPPVVMGKMAVPVTPPKTKDSPE